MRLIFAPEASEDYLYWQETDKQAVRRMHLLIKDAMRSTFSGIGKPEPLRYVLSGFWSRRITEQGGEEGNGDNSFNRLKTLSHGRR